MTIPYAISFTIALIHIYILILEMFLWTTNRSIKIFNLKNKEFAEETKILAANQGLYNGFIAAGLLWGILHELNHVIIFFLICVTIAGIYGAYSTKITRIFFIQSIPAILALFTFFTH